MRTLMAVATAALLTAGAAGAAERTVTLAVDNMSCVTCPYIVKQSLAAVRGVSAVEVSYEAKTAVVTFEDDATDLAALTAATAGVGFPSRPVE
ncbi:MAG: cation transporter [Dongiaceae bacterium]